MGWGLSVGENWQGWTYLPAFTPTMTIHDTSSPLLFCCVSRYLSPFSCHTLSPQPRSLGSAIETWKGDTHTTNACAHFPSMFDATPRQCQLSLFVLFISSLHQNALFLIPFQCFTKIVKLLPTESMTWMTLAGCTYITVDNIFMSWKGLLFYQLLPIDLAFLGLILYMGL